MQISHLQGQGLDPREGEPFSSALQEPRAFLMVIYQKKTTTELQWVRSVGLEKRLSVATARITP